MLKNNNKKKSHIKKYWVWETPAIYMYSRQKMKDTWNSKLFEIDVYKKKYTSYK